MLGLQTQRVMQRRMDVAANNLANVSTNGFKADGLLLEEADRTTAHADADPEDIRFVRDIGIVHYMEQGPIEMTGNPLDVALEGDGFIMVQGPDGSTMYTRDGAFTLTGDGRLVTSDGHPVLSSGGAPIVLDPQGGAPHEPGFSSARLEVDGLAEALHAGHGREAKAIAIGLSEARKEGAKVPRKKTAKRSARSRS